MQANQRRSVNLSNIGLAPVLTAAEAFVDAAHDFAELALRETAGSSRALSSFHGDAVDKLYTLRRRLTEAGLYDLSRRPDRVGSYDGPILMMCGAADDRRVEVCTHVDYLRAAVAALWQQVRPYFCEKGGEYEFFIEARAVKRFCFDTAAVARVEGATRRLRATTGAAPPDGLEGTCTHDRQDRWLTVSEAAAIASVDPGTISRAADSGKLRTNALKQSKRRICADGLCRWIYNRVQKLSARESDENRQQLLSQQARD